MSPAEPDPAHPRSLRRGAWTMFAVSLGIVVAAVGAVLPTADRPSLADGASVDDGGAAGGGGAPAGGPTANGAGGAAGLSSAGGSAGSDGAAAPGSGGGTSSEGQDDPTAGSEPGGGSSAAVALTPVGTYHFDYSGDRTAASTFVVTDAGADSRRQQETAEDGQRVERVLQRRGDGLWVTELSATSGTTQLDWALPAGGVLLVPADPVVGATWSWSIATTDGRRSVEASFEVLERSTAEIDGETIEVVMIQSHQRFSGDVDAQAVVTSAWDPERAITISETQEVPGSAGTTVVERRLRSRQPQ